MPARPAAPRRLRLDRETVRRLTEQGPRSFSEPLPTEPVESHYDLCQLTRDC
ncbi:MAG: hypothetical protein AB1941_11300 [Gemmatimonadota bacterium]